MGISGRIARFFLGSQLTPLIALVAVLLGVFAVLVTPREEEPQINVTMANVLIPFPGASAKDVEALVATPAEQVLAQITGIEHVYSVSKPGMAVLTVQFKVGENRTDAAGAAVRHDHVEPRLGVARISASASRSSSRSASTTCRSSRSPCGPRTRSAAPTSSNAWRTPPRSRSSACPARATVQTIGGPSRSVRVLLDPERMQAYRIAAQDIRQALIGANASLPSGALVGGNRETLVETGTFLASARDVAQIVVGATRTARCSWRTSRASSTDRSSRSATSGTG